MPFSLQTFKVETTAHLVEEWLVRNIPLALQQFARERDMMLTDSSPPRTFDFSGARVVAVSGYRLMAAPGTERTDLPDVVLSERRPVWYRFELRPLTEQTVEQVLHGWNDPYDFLPWFLRQMADFLPMRETSPSPGDEPSTVPTRVKPAGRTPGRNRDRDAYIVQLYNEGKPNYTIESEVKKHYHQRQWIGQDRIKQIVKAYKGTARLEAKTN